MTEWSHGPGIIVQKPKEELDDEFDGATVLSNVVGYTRQNLLNEKAEKKGE